jgi:hypothetical protein
VALVLPGTAGNYVNFGATHPANFDTNSSNLFCEAWIYLNSFQSVATTIIGRQNTIASPAEDWMLWINGSRQPQFRVTSTTNASQDASLATVMNTGQWYHMAGSWDNTNKKLYVFLNGTASAATNFSGTARFNSTWAIQLGIYTGGQYLDGYIRDVRVVQGGSVPTANFTPDQVPFAKVSPAYVPSMGTPVLVLYGQFFANGKYVVYFPNGVATSSAYYGLTFSPQTITGTMIQYRTISNPSTYQTFLAGSTDMSIKYTNNTLLGATTDFLG